MFPWKCRTRCVRDAVQSRRGQGSWSGPGQRLFLAHSQGQPLGAISWNVFLVCGLVFSTMYTPEYLPRPQNLPKLLRNLGFRVREPSPCVRRHSRMQNPVAAVQNPCTRSMSSYFGFRAIGPFEVANTFWENVPLAASPDKPLCGTLLY